MRELIVQASGGFSFRVTVSPSESLRVAAKRIARQGFFVDRDGVEVDPEFEGEWTYCPPGQITAVQFRQ